MRIGTIIKVQQVDIYNNLSKNRNYSKKNNKKKNNSSQEELLFDDIEKLMRHSSYKRCKGGVIKQIK